MQGPRYIHVGYPKTATTYLQQEVFPHVPGIAYLGKPLHDKAVETAFADLRFLDDVSFRKDECFERLRSYVRSKGGQSDNGLLLSYEGFVCPKHWGTRLADRSIIAQRLHQVFGEAKIIITLREQISWLGSYYLRHIKPYHGQFAREKEWFLENYGAPGHGILGQIEYYPLV